MLRKTGLATMCVMAVLAACIGAGEKEVPYIATPHEVVAAMLEMAQVREAETVYDLGCGDGRIVIAAARDRKARGIGVDIDPERIAESRENARKAGVAGRTSCFARRYPAESPVYAEVGQEVGAVHPAMGHRGGRHLVGRVEHLAARPCAGAG